MESYQKQPSIAIITNKVYHASRKVGIENYITTQKYWISLPGRVAIDEKDEKPACFSDRRSCLRNRQPHPGDEQAGFDSGTTRPPLYIGQRGDFAGRNPGLAMVEVDLIPAIGGSILNDGGA